MQRRQPQSLLELLRHRLRPRGPAGSRPAPLPPASARRPPGAGPDRGVTITTGPQGLEIVIPAPRNLFLLSLLGVWLMAWGAGELSALERLRSGRGADPEELLLVWLVIWTAAGLLAAYAWLWMLVGQERIVLGTSSLRIRREILGVGLTRTYPLLRIRSLRVEPPPPGDRESPLVFRLAGLSGGTMAFDHEGQTVRCGAGLAPAEAARILERMRLRHVFPDPPRTRLA